jgi:drug/metabolite transporter (DMT)-like permease
MWLVAAAIGVFGGLFVISQGSPHSGVPLLLIAAVPLSRYFIAKRYLQRRADERQHQLGRSR